MREGGGCGVGFLRGCLVFKQTGLEDGDVAPCAATNLRLRIGGNKHHAQGVSGGETGIRTLGPREGSTVFETAPFDHSGTSPRGSGGSV